MSTPPGSSSSWLPPKPDAETGEPRPPRAPRAFGGDESTPVTQAPRKHPAGPDGRGLTLEWRQETTRSSVWAGVVTALLVLGLPTVNSWSFDWMARPSWWAFFGPLAFIGGWIMYKAFGKMWIAAGATWLQTGRFWVDVYQLTEVRIKAAGVNQMLRLKDSVGREVSVKISDVQRNQALWDLVYNGILHSVVSGSADPSRGTRTILKLPGGRIN